MKFELKSAENTNNISRIRGQIKEAADLRKFDDFLEANNTFDFDDKDDATAARACCGGDHCCENITIEFSIKAQ